MSSPIVAKIEAIAERVAQSEGIEIVEIELKGGGKNRFLRISIDKPEGVTHADCETISHQVGTILDVEDVEIDRVRAGLGDLHQVLDDGVGGSADRLLKQPTRVHGLGPPRRLRRVGPAEDGDHR